jgi:hypothetical protein
MQIRQVKWVGGGARGLGVDVGLRFFAQGSARARRFFGFGTSAFPACSERARYVWERRTRLLEGSGGVVCTGLRAVALVRAMGEELVVRRMSELRVDGGMVG